MSYFPSGHQGQGNRPQHHQAFQAKNKSKTRQKITKTMTQIFTLQQQTNKHQLSINKICTVIIVIMPPPHFYRKYAPPFSEGSFLKILWLEMPG